MSDSYEKERAEKARRRTIYCFQCGCPHDIPTNDSRKEKESSQTYQNLIEQ